MDEYSAMANSAPELEGARARLRRLVPADLDFLYSISTDPRTGHLWRYRGSTPSPEKFQHDLWNGVLVQFVVEDRLTNRPVGHVVAYDAEPASHHCRIGVVSAPNSRRSGLGVEGLVLLCTYLFQHWPLHKVYADVPDFGIDQFGSAVGRFLSEEGRLREHGYMRGRLYDLVLLAGYKRDWEAASTSLLGSSATDSSALSDPAQGGTVSLEQFVHDLSMSLDLQIQGLHGGTPLGDLALDSLAIAELREHLRQYGEEVPDGLLEGARNIGDLHHYASAVLERRVIEA